MMKIKKVLHAKTLILIVTLGFILTSIVYSDSNLRVPTDNRQIKARFDNISLVQGVKILDSTTLIYAASSEEMSLRVPMRYALAKAATKSLVLNWARYEDLS